MHACYRACTPSCLCIWSSSGCLESLVSHGTFCAVARSSLIWPCLLWFMLKARDLDWKVIRTSKFFKFLKCCYWSMKRLFNYILQNKISICSFGCHCHFIELCGFSLCSLSNAKSGNSCQTLLSCGLWHKKPLEQIIVWMFFFRLAVAPCPRLKVGIYQATIWVVSGQHWMSQTVPVHSFTDSFCMGILVRINAWHCDFLLLFPFLLMYVSVCIRLWERRLFVGCRSGVCICVSVLGTIWQLLTPLYTSFTTPPALCAAEGRRGYKTF